MLGHRYCAITFHGGRAEWHVLQFADGQFELRSGVFSITEDAFLHAAAVDAHYLCGRRCPAALLYLEEGGQAGMGVVLDPDHCRHRERFRLRGRFIGQDAELAHTINLIELNGQGMRLNRRLPHFSRLEAGTMLWNFRRIRI